MNRFHRWYCQSDRWRRAVRSELVPWALKGIELGDDVLEVGPGPGLVTDVLAKRAVRLTSVEIDARMAEALAQRKRGTQVRVIHADATDLPFPDSSFSGAVSFTMLHHVPSTELQDRLFSEVRRVLRPGALFAGSDSTPSPLFNLAHWFDTLVPVDPAGLAERLLTAGFSSAEVRPAAHAFRFCAVR